MAKVRVRVGSSREATMQAGIMLLIGLAMLIGLGLAAAGEAAPARAAPVPPIVSAELDADPAGTVLLPGPTAEEGSRTGGRGRYVYTPPDNEKETSARYPVLYLFHGSGDNEATWTVLGRAHMILDNLLARGQAKPMIVVMPDGHAAPPQPRGGPPEGR